MSAARLEAIIGLLVEEVAERVAARVSAQAPRQVEGYIGTTEAARRAGVQPATVTDWIKRGALPAARPQGSRGYKIKPGDLEAFLAGAERAGGPAVLPAPADLTTERTRRIVDSIVAKSGRRE